MESEPAGAGTTGGNNDSARFYNRVIKIAFAAFLVGVALGGLLPRIDPNGFSLFTFAASMLVAVSPIAALVAAAHRDGAHRGPLPLKQWSRFSLRTLLIAMTLIAAAATWIAFWAKE